MMGGSSVAQGRGGPHSQVPPQPNLRNQVPPPILPSQVEQLHICFEGHPEPTACGAHCTSGFSIYFLVNNTSAPKQHPDLGFLQVPPSLLKYPGGNGALNPLFGAQQVAVLNQLTQLNHLTQLNQISQLQVQ